MRSLAWLQGVQASTLSPNARLVASAFACHCRGGSQPLSGAPVDRIMGWTGLSRSSVQRARDELATAGWIVVVHGSRGGRTLANDYALVDGRAKSESGGEGVPRATPSAAPPHSPSPDFGVSSRHREGVTERPTEGVSQTPLKAKGLTKGRDLEAQVLAIAERLAL